MPELAEVEHSRRQWDPGIGQTVLGVDLARPEIRVFRGTDTEVLRAQLLGKKLLASQASGKQMLFQFSGDLWLGVHLGMSGELRREDQPDYPSRKHDHLVLRQEGRALVFEDKRHFGRVRLHQGSEPPAWWSSLAPSVLSEEFTLPKLARFLERRRRTPLKAVLLMQEHFPGVGNWMADEILWRARLHPSTPAGTLDPEQVQRLWQQVRWVSRTAIRIIDDDWRYPKTWLFSHRWEAGGSCPRCKTDLARATIGGRTTCWCPECQPTPVPTPQAEAKQVAQALKSRRAKTTRPTIKNVASTAPR